ncbi:MAG: cysteine desulfurase [Gammaproteobacteria bacterium]|nr:cysteine desulfurase [Gammaproteobacteria bacterium]
MVYLDHNASTPMDAVVLDVMLPFLQGHAGNASSVHQAGRVARAAIDHAREQVAALVNVQPAQVVFTAGGTEANNTALKSMRLTHGSSHLVVSSIEHESVLAPARYLQQQGCRLDYAGVDTQGRVDKDALQLMLSSGAQMLSVVMANNETGVVQDIAALAEMAREHDVIMHTDAVQAAGKMALDFSALGVQMMSLSAHKMYGPKGIGALILDPALELAPLLHGGSQERARRAGTENVAAIAGFGKAAELAAVGLLDRVVQLKALQIYLRQQLETLPGVVMFSAEAECIPNTVQCSVLGIEGETLLMQLDREGFAVSSGAACSSADSHPSHVLMAMGVAQDLARGAIRISLGKMNTVTEIDQFVVALNKVIGWSQRMVREA